MRHGHGLNSPCYPGGSDVSLTRDLFCVEPSVVKALEQKLFNLLGREQELHFPLFLRVARGKHACPLEAAHRRFFNVYRSTSLGLLLAVELLEIFVQVHIERLYVNFLPSELNSQV